LPSDTPPPFKRHDPTAWTRTLAYRDRAVLPYDGAAYPIAATLMLDATVYIDAQRPGRLPAEIAARIATAPLLHSAVALAELAADLGMLDPGHPNTPVVRTAIEATLHRIAPERVVAPSAEAWAEGAVIAGTLARTQALARGDRRKLLNDALIFLTAWEANAVLISRNKNDIDLLLRFRPDVQVLLYDVG